MINSDFYTNIFLKYPTITRNEQNLCSLLKENLSTREISKITGKRMNAIEVARVRLRKKLGLTNSKVNLNLFMHTI